MRYLESASEYQGEVPVCPTCSNPMELQQTNKWRYPHNNRPRWFWRCGADEVTHGAHPDGRPLGTPADDETKAARIEAHSALDDLIAVKVWDKRRAYEWMQQAMGLTPEQAHIGRFYKKQCEALMEACAQAKFGPISGAGTSAPQPSTPGSPATGPGNAAGSSSAVGE